MALIDELKERREKITAAIEEKRESRKAIQRDINALWGDGDDLDAAIAALEAPAQPVHPEAELRSVPGAEEEVRDPLIDAQTTDPVDPRVEGASDEPDALAEFMKLPGAVKYGPEGWPVPLPQDDEWLEVIYGNGETKQCYASEGGKVADPSRGSWKAYRILEAPAPEQDASVETQHDEPIPDDIVRLPEIVTDLWQQGYDDKANGYEPSLAEPEYTKGYEARALIEREHRETMERAKFFDGGMMADADRHQSDQRGIVAKMFDALKPKVDA